jgi:DNA-3-methyladenine glycosylase II
MAGEESLEAGSLTVALREVRTLVGARLTASDGRCGLDCDLFSPAPLTDDVVTAVRDRLTFRFSLDDDLASFYALADTDPPFAAVVRRLHGYHQVKFPSPLELLCWAILCQRIPMPVARGMKQAIVAACGNDIVVEGRELQAFPDAEQLLALSQDRLQELIGNGRKAAYLYGTLRGWVEIDEEFLRTGEYAAVREWLLSLPGIGPWSASFVLIRGLGRTEGMAPDPEVLRAASAAYARPVDAAGFSQLASRYGAFQGYWGHYLRVGS